MGATLNLSHTYAGREYLQELFYVPQEAGQNIFDIYKVFSNVKTKLNLYLPGTLEKILRKYTTCGFSAVGSMEVTDRILDPEKLKINFKQCVDAFFDSAIEEITRAGTDIDKLDGTMIESMLLRKVQDAMRSDIPRISWFAKVGAASADYNQFDGWIQKFFDGSAELGQYVDIATITGVEDGSGVLVADGALVLLRNMWKNQAKVLKEMPKAEKKFYVTDTVADNLIETYEEIGTDSGLRMLQDGTDRLYFRGVEVVVVSGWDTQLADADNPQAAAIGENLVVYTIPANLAIGTDINSSEASLRIRSAEDDDEEYKITAKLRLGVNYIHGELVSLAY